MFNRPTFGGHIIVFVPFFASILSVKIIDLLNLYPNIDIKVMGFPANWQEEALWKEN